MTTPQPDVVQATANPVVPDHVPPDLVWHDSIDSFPMQFDDPYVGATQALHAGPDIFWATKSAHGGRPGWILTRFQHIEEVYLDAARFSAAHSNGAARFLGFDLRLLPTESDPPDHRIYRQALQPFFQPSAIKALEDMVRETCDELMAPLERSNGCEFVSGFASLFPSHIFLKLMGMPIEKLPEFFEWEHAFLRGSNWQEQVAGTRALFDYMQEYTRERRDNPGNDLVSKVVTAEVHGKRLDEMDVIGMCMTLYLGGLDTVMNSMGWCLRHIARDQALQDRLRNDPALIPAAVDELMRAYGVTSTFRTVMEDLEFHGVPMRKGDIVALPTFLASRDERRYANPHVIDLDRSSRSLSFGSGVHNCLGIHLAKRELRVVIARFLERFRNIRIADNDREQWTTVMIWGVQRLPLAWDR